MSYKHESDGSNIPEQLDKRVKLSKAQKCLVYCMYIIEGGYSQRDLAKRFGVSYIVSPEQKIEMLKCRAERGGSKIYYNKDKNTVAIRKHRAYKQSLKLNGELCYE